MCGIHLIWGKGANEEAIHRLLQLSNHRGPDHKSACSPWPGLWLGANRLKIIDPNPDSDQPFWSADQNYLLVWNGEIYNFKELRTVLEKMGEQFSTVSDTEVLLKYLRIFGEKALPRLKGMFALAFVDLFKKSVLIARDPSGEKPLYFAQNSDTLFVSSETRGIAALIGSSWDVAQVNPYFYLRNPIPGKTFFKKIRAWKPSRYSTISAPSTFRWDSISFQKSSERAHFSSFKKLLDAAVHRQFSADVPVGMMLSGGADSSLLYSIWYRETGKSLPAYTIQVEKKYASKYADATFAKKFTAEIPADHELIYIDQDIFLKNWDEYLRSVDQPIGDSAGFLTWMIGKRAKNSVKVLIGGAGADELWGGYQRHRAFQKYLAQQEFWVKWAPILKNLPLGRERRKFLQAIHPDPHQTFLNFSALQNPDPELMEDYSRIFNKTLPLLKQSLDFDRQVYLTQDVLKILDNALMAHSIEGRSPYLDHDLISLWNDIEDPKILLGKPWIKQYLSEIGLGWIANRKKFGFGLPLQEWFTEGGPVSQRIFSTLRAWAKDHEKLLPKAVRQLCIHPELGAKTQFLTIYNLFLLAEWVNLRKP